MVLNHDTPSEFVYRNNYNTTNDVVASLSRESFGGAFAAPTNPKTMSLCFKLPFLSPCELLHPTVISSNAAVQNWLSLADEFLFNVTQAVHTHNLSLRVLLDGGSNPGQYPCLANRWRPLQSMYISGRDPDAAFTSDNRTLGWDRLVVLNEDQAHWAFAAQHAFGKFANLSNPYLVWEPSDESTIRQDTSLYLASTFQNPAGMRFATNLDPAQLLTYSARESGSVWNAEVGVLPNSSHHVLATHVAGSPPQGSVADHLLLVWALPSGSAQAALLQLDSALRPAPGAVRTVFQSVLPPDMLGNETVLVSLAGAVFMPSAPGANACVQVQLGAIKLQSGAEASLQSWDVTFCAGTGAAAKQAWSVSLPSYVTPAGVAATPGPCQSAGDGETQPPCTVVAFLGNDSSCSVYMGQVSAASPASFKAACVAIAAANTAAALGQVQIATMSEGGILLAAAARDSNVYGAVVPHGQVMSASAAEAQPLRWLYSGNAVSLAPGAAGVFAVLQDGFCPNNEPSNKAAWPSSCHQTPVSQPEVLTYATASASEWVAALAGAAPAPPAGEPPHAWACSALYEPPVTQQQALRGSGEPVFGPGDAPFPGQAVSHCSAKQAIGAFTQGRNATAVCSAEHCWVLARLPATGCARCGPAQTGDSWRLYGWQ